MASTWVIKLISIESERYHECSSAERQAKMSKELNSVSVPRTLVAI